MKSYIRWGAVLGATLVLALGAMAQNPGRNAFLKTSVRTTSQLVAQVKTNRQIRDAYLRHFAMNEAELYAYLRTLRPMKLTEDGTYTVYSVPPDGALVPHTQKMKKGEIVFLEPGGKIVLRGRCGNPTVKPDQGIVPEEVAINAGPAMPHDMVVGESEYIPVLPLALEPAPPIVPELIVETPPTPAPQIIPPVIGSSPNLLPLLLLAPLLGGSGGGDGGGPPVPEPLTILTLAAGAGLVMRRRRKTQ